MLTPLILSAFMYDVVAYKGYGKWFFNQLIKSFRKV